MADIDFDDFDGGYGMASQPVVRRYDRFVHLAGAATSALLVIGAIWWGYQLAVRDVTGVPVMRALGGPMRIAPADPGGDVAGHQGLSVNAVAAAGTAAPLPDTLFLAPAPQGLTDEDAAGLAEPIVSLESSALVPEEAVPANASFAADTSLIATEIPTADQDAVAAALAEALGEAAPVEAAETATITLASSLRPMARPSNRTATTSAEPAPEAAPETLAATPAISANVAEVDPSTISAGTRLVQLGAFDDEASARSDWARLAGRFPEVMADKSLVIEAAQSGGRTFYRLRALGFADVDDSRRFCTVLLAENATCIPVTQR